MELLKEKKKMYNLKKTTKTFVPGMKEWMKACSILNLELMYKLLDEFPDLLNSCDPIWVNFLKIY